MIGESNLYEAMQREFCKERDVSYVASLPALISGLAVPTLRLSPINGLRHPITDGTTGWFIWGGQEFSSESDFFSPVHTGHIYEELPELRPLLGLPPGSRFLIAGKYLDVWFDESLFKT